MRGGFSRSGVVEGLCFLVAGLWWAFWLHGQRLYDDDYGRWLVPSADIPWSSLAKSLVRPWPADWGFLDRPAVMALFKIASLAPEVAAAWIFPLKACAMAALVALATLGARTLAQGRAALVVMPVVLMANDGAFGSLLWASDSEVAAQLLILAGWLAHRRAGSLPAGSRRLAWLCLVLLCVVLGPKWKASAKLLPLLLMLDWALLGRGMGRDRAAIALVSLGLTVPWPLLADHLWPPILDPLDRGRVEPFYWRRWTPEASWTRLWGAGPVLFPVEPRLVTGLFEAWTPWAAVLIVVATARGAWRGIGREAAFLAGWFALAALLLGSTPDIPGPFVGRYLLAPALPASMLMSLAVGRFVGAGRPASWLAVTLLVLHSAVGLADMRVRKSSQGCEIAVQDLCRERVEAAVEGATIFLVDLPDTGFRPTTRTNRWRSVGGEALAAEWRSAPRPRVAVSAGSDSTSRWHIEPPGGKAYWTLFGPKVCGRDVRIE